MAISIFAFVTSWLTPGSLFLFLNIMIVTIVLASRYGTHNKPVHEDQHLARAPSLLQRVKSIDYFSFYNFPPAQEPGNTTQEHDPPQLERAPSLLQRVKSIDYFSFYKFPPAQEPENTTQEHDPPQLERAPSLLERVKSINFSSLYYSSGPEAQGNLDTAAYTTTPDNKIQLTPSGLAQARQAGNHLYNIISNDENKNWRVYFYVSPYDRTRSTLREIGRSFKKERIIGVREECRVREQDFGNFQVKERMKVIKESRERFGRFFYRFPEGESAADVFDRVSGFLESLWRDIDMKRFHRDPSHDLNLIIVSHGLTCRVFLMKWFKWTVQQFEHLNNPGNCEFRIMQLGPGGEYSLAIHHTDEEMLEWGLSPEMIDDQKWRMRANKGDWNEKCPWYLDEFFDHVADSDRESGDKENGSSGMCE